MLGLEHAWVVGNFPWGGGVTRPQSERGYDGSDNGPKMNNLEYPSGDILYILYMSLGDNTNPCSMQRNQSRFILLPNNIYVISYKLYETSKGLKAMTFSQLVFNFFLTLFPTFSQLLLNFFSTVAELELFKGFFLSRRPPPFSCQTLFGTDVH